MAKNEIIARLQEAQGHTGTSNDKSYVSLLFEVHVTTEWENLEKIKKNLSEITQEDFLKLLQDTIKPKEKSKCKD